MSKAQILSEFCCMLLDACMENKFCKRNKCKTPSCQLHQICNAKIRYMAKKYYREGFHTNPAYKMVKKGKNVEFEKMNKNIVPNPVIPYKKISNRK